MGGTNYFEDIKFTFDPNTFKPIPCDPKRSKQIMDKVMKPLNTSEKNRLWLETESKFGKPDIDVREEDEDPITHDYYLNSETGLRKFIKQPKPKKLNHLTDIITMEKQQFSSQIVSEKIDHNIQEIEIKKEPVKLNWKKPWGKKK